MVSKDPSARILDEVAAYYAGRLAEFGPTAKGVDWNGEPSQQLRHRQFLRLLQDAPEASVLDLGCGYGDFLGFLRASGHQGRYVGYDVSPEMVAAAQRLHGTGPDRGWKTGAVPEPGEADYAVASGIFNVKGSVSAKDWDAYVRQTIDVLAKAGRRGFAFNVLSLSSDPERRHDRLFYADPPGLLSFCLSRYGRRVALLQDYGLYEFTMIVRHEPVT